MSDRLAGEPAVRDVIVAVNGNGNNKPATIAVPELLAEEQIFQADGPNGFIPSIDDFDEIGYLTLNPDVHDAVEAGQLESGYAHYVLHGHAERRPLPDLPREPRNVMIAAEPQAWPSERQKIAAGCAIDALHLDRPG